MFHLISKNLKNNRHQLLCLLFSCLCFALKISTKERKKSFTYKKFRLPYFNLLLWFPPLEIHSNSHQNADRTVLSISTLRVVSLELWRHRKIQIIHLRGKTHTRRRRIAWKMDFKTILQKISPLQQLLEDINFQRTKELRNLMKDGESSARNCDFSFSSPNYRFFPPPYNFQRFYSFSDSGFVVLQGNTQWTEIFVRHFLFQTQREASDSDDLLFFVRKKYVKGSNRNAPKYDTEIEVRST